MALSNSDSELRVDLQAFVDVRRRPGLFLLIPTEELLWNHALAIRSALRNRQFAELDLVIHSSGGYGDVAYLIIQMLRLHTQKLNACVPLWAKSAATLLCIGADRIVLDELAQLGPLDPQTYIGEGELSSSLNAFKNLEELTTFSEDTLHDVAKMLADTTELPVDECIKHAIHFVEVVSGPLFRNLDLKKLGEYSRALSVSKEYSLRLLNRLDRWQPEQAEEVIQQLVYGYPSHEYVIDFYELKALGFQVELFSKQERTAVEGLFKYCLTEEAVEISAQTCVELLEPSTAQVGPVEIEVDRNPGLSQTNGSATQ
jgi:alpha-acetolactate decarboxylase